jgi:anti-sigma factor RsiW
MEHLDVELAHRLLRGQLDPQARADWQHHVHDCPRCRDLLAGEREWMGLVALGQGAAPAAAPPAPRLASRIQQAVPGGPARRTKAWLLSGELAALAALSAILVWQVAGARVADAARQSPPGIPPELQGHVVANLEALAALAHDPWLADQYEDVQMLERLIVEQEPQAP